jgi:hypothetical protein
LEFMQDKPPAVFGLEEGSDEESETDEEKEKKSDSSASEKEDASSRFEYCRLNMDYIIFISESEKEEEMVSTPKGQAKPSLERGYA